MNWPNSLIWTSRNSFVQLTWASKRECLLVKPSSKRLTTPMTPSTRRKAWIFWERLIKNYTSSLPLWNRPYRRIRVYRRYQWIRRMKTSLTLYLQTQIGSAVESVAASNINKATVDYTLITLPVRISEVIFRSTNTSRDTFKGQRTMWLSFKTIWVIIQAFQKAVPSIKAD